MTPEEADAVVEEAIARGTAKYTAPNPDHLTTVERAHDEYEELAKIHMASLTDWTIQLAYIVADQKWDRADNALIAANHALQKLAGAVSKLMEK